MTPAFIIRCILAFALGFVLATFGVPVALAVGIVIGVDLIVKAACESEYDRGWSDLHAKVMPLVDDMANLVKDKT